MSASIEIDPTALLLIDIGHIFWRTWHATGSRVDAYRETVERCQRLASMWPRTVVCCDSPTNWRHKLTEHLEGKERYKANRPPKPKDAIESLIDAEERLASDGMRVVKLDGYEADDIIATLKTQSWLYRVVILSEDKDLAQLVDENCVLWTRNGERGVDDVKRTYGVFPHQIRDLLAFWGDASDNVPGCPGVGQGKASKLLDEFGSLDNIKA